jgi:hypothetical protein
MGRQRKLEKLEKYFAANAFDKISKLIVKEIKHYVTSIAKHRELDAATMEGLKSVMNGFPRSHENNVVEMLTALRANIDRLTDIEYYRSILLMHVEFCQQWIDCYNRVPPRDICLRFMIAWTLLDRERYDQHVSVLAGSFCVVEQMLIHYQRIANEKLVQYMKDKLTTKLRRRIEKKKKKSKQK